MEDIKDTDNRKCERNDLRVYTTTNTEVEDNGQPVFDKFVWYEIHYDEPYFCTNCDTLFVTWEETLAHLNK